MRFEMERLKNVTTKLLLIRRYIYYFVTMQFFYNWCIRECVEACPLT